jgi:hypothetical protein
MQMALMLFSLGFVPTRIKVAKADKYLGNKAERLYKVNWLQLTFHDLI